MIICSGPGTSALVVYTSCHGSCVKGCPPSSCALADTVALLAARDAEGVMDPLGILTEPTGNSWA